ncbi:MAG: hypothetical protein AAFN77_24600 [Planctomycetota bacterium]
MNRKNFLLAIIAVIAIASSAYFLWPPELPDSFRSAAGLNTKELRTDDRIAIALVAWTIHGDPLFDFPSGYPDQKLMLDAKRFIVSCDFVPDSVFLSEDKRVFRIDEEDFEETFDALDFDGNSYMEIRVIERTENQIRVEFTNFFGRLGGHGYDFTFTIDESGGISVSGGLYMVS